MRRVLVLSVLVVSLSGCGIADMIANSSAVVDVGALVGQRLGVVIHNTGDEGIDYRRSCTLPFQQRVGDSWKSFPQFVACQAYAPVLILPDGRLEIEVILPPSTLLESEMTEPELRVIVDLQDEDGPLPLDMRTSRPFRLQAE